MEVPFNIFRQNFHIEISWTFLSMYLLLPIHSTSLTLIFISGKKFCWAPPCLSFLFLCWQRSWLLLGCGTLTLNLGTLHSFCWLLMFFQRLADPGIKSSIHFSYISYKTMYSFRRKKSDCNQFNHLFEIFSYEFITSVEINKTLQKR